MLTRIHSGLGDKLDLSGLKNGGAFAGLDRPLGGIGIKRDPFGENKRLLTLGRPVSGFNPDGNCPAGRRYVCDFVQAKSVLTLSNIFAVLQACPKVGIVSRAIVCIASNKPLSYSDPRNSGLLGSAFVQDGSMNVSFSRIDKADLFIPALIGPIGWSHL